MGTLWIQIVLDLNYYSNTQTITSPLFVIAQITIPKLWNQPRYPSTDEWIKKVWYMYTMEYYSSIRKNEIMAFASSG